MKSKILLPIVALLTKHQSSSSPIIRCRNEPSDRCNTALMCCGMASQGMVLDNNGKETKVKAPDILACNFAPREGISQAFTLEGQLDYFEQKIPVRYPSNGFECSSLEGNPPKPNPPKVPVGLACKPETDDDHNFCAIDNKTE